MRIGAAIRLVLVAAGLVLGRGAAAQDGSGDPLILPELPETLVLPEQPGATLAPALPHEPGAEAPADDTGDGEAATSGSPEAVDAPDAETDSAAALPSPFFPGSLESLEATRAAPLFTPSRTPPAAEPEPEPEPEEPEVAVATDAGPPSLKLIGILRLGADEVAILADESTGAVQRLKPGDDYEGWTVAVLDGQTVELRNGEQSHKLSMFTEYPETGQPPTPAPDPDAEGFSEPGQEETMFGGGSDQSDDAIPTEEEPGVDENGNVQ